MIKSQGQKENKHENEQRPMGPEETNLHMFYGNPRSSCRVKTQPPEIVFLYINNEQSK